MPISGIMRSFRNFKNCSFFKTQNYQWLALKIVFRLELKECSGSSMGVVVTEAVVSGILCESVETVTMTYC